MLAISRKSQFLDLNIPSTAHGHLRAGRGQGRPTDRQTDGQKDKKTRCEEKERYSKERTREDSAREAREEKRGRDLTKA